MRHAGHILEAPDLQQ